jgi:hypothetical protein
MSGDEVWKAGADLGRLLDDLDLGPESKVEAHELLYTFHLGTMVIRVVD